MTDDCVAGAVVLRTCRLLYYGVYWSYSPSHLGEGSEERLGLGSRERSTTRGPRAPALCSRRAPRDCDEATMHRGYLGYGVCEQMWLKAAAHASWGRMCGGEPRRARAP